jgi:hypothetical protein
MSKARPSGKSHNTTDELIRQLAAEREREAAALQEEEKRQRPGRELVAAVHETGARTGVQGDEWHDVVAGRMVSLVEHVRRADVEAEFTTHVPGEVEIRRIVRQVYREAVKGKKQAKAAIQRFAPYFQGGTFLAAVVDVGLAAHRAWLRREEGGPANDTPKTLPVNLPEVTGPAPRLTVDVVRQTITLDNTTHDTTELAARWVRVLADHPGQWISGPDLIDFDKRLDGTRTDRLRPQLPREVDELIDCVTGKGSRIRLA